MYLPSRKLVLACVLPLLGTVAGVKVVHGVRSALSSSIDLGLLMGKVARLVDGKVPYVEYAAYYPPSSLLILAPIYGPWTLDLLAPVWAGVNWLIWGMILWTLIRLYLRQCDTPTQLMILLVGVAMRSTHHGIGNGQIGILALGGIVASLTLCKRERWLGAGLALTVGLVKPSLAIPFLAFFAVRQYWRPLVIAVAAHVLFTLAVAAWVQEGPVKLVMAWFRLAASSMKSGANLGTVDLAALVNYFELPDSFGTPLSIGYLAAMWFFVFMCRRASDLDLLGVLGVVSMTWTYHRLYDHITLIFAVLAITRVVLLKQGDFARGLGLFALVIISSVMIVPAKLPPLWYEPQYLVLWTLFVLSVLFVTMWRALHPGSLSFSSNKQVRPGI